jgi:cytochrome c5
LIVSAVALLTALLALATAGSPAGGVAGFGDVEAQLYYTNPVQWMVDNDITTGVSETCFRPDQDVTRGQAAAFLWRMEEMPTGSPAHPFNDVPLAWQQDAVSWLYANEVTTGTTATTFSPDDELTRGQLAALLHRLAGMPTGSPAHPFNDVPLAWQQDAVSWLYANGITTGTSSTTFSPADPATRGQVATMLHRYKGEPAVVVDPTSPFCAPPTTTTTTTTTIAGPSGAAVFSANCATCHGSGGSGGFGPRLIGNTLSTTQIRTQVNGGGGGMPPFAGRLSSAEISAVVGYVASL